MRTLSEKANKRRPFPSLRQTGVKEPLKRGVVLTAGWLSSLTGAVFISRILKSI